MLTAGKTVGKAAARLAAKKAAKIAVKTGFKVALSSVKMGLKSAAGPIGWALLAFDLFSMTLDLIDISGYEKMQTIDMFVLQRESIKQELNTYMNNLAKENKKNGEKGNLNYPLIVGPLNNLNPRDFESELQLFEESEYDKMFMKFLIKELELLKEEKSVDLIDIYLSRKYGTRNPFENKYIELFKLDWDLLEDSERNDFKVLGWNVKLWKKNKKPDLYLTKWTDLNDNQKVSALNLGYTCNNWSKGIEKFISIKIGKYPNCLFGKSGNCCRKHIFGAVDTKNCGSTKDSKSVSKVFKIIGKYPNCLYGKSGNCCRKHIFGAVDTKNCGSTEDSESVSKITKKYPNCLYGISGNCCRKHMFGGVDTENCGLEEESKLTEKSEQEEEKSNDILNKKLILKDMKSNENKIIDKVNKKLEKAIKEYNMKELNDDELKKYNKFLINMVNKEIIDNEKILENENLIDSIVDKETQSTDKCTFDLKEIDENSIIKELVDNTTLSPLYDDSNFIIEKVEEKLFEYFESDEYYNKFLMRLCQNIMGNGYREHLLEIMKTHFHKGSKCSYSSIKDCDNSYNWNLINNRYYKDVNPAFLHVDEKLTNFYNLLENNKTLKTGNSKMHKEIFDFFDNKGKPIYEWVKIQKV